MSHSGCLQAVLACVLTNVTCKLIICIITFVTVVTMTEKNSITTILQKNVFCGDHVNVCIKILVVSMTTMLNKGIHVIKAKNI